MGEKTKQANRIPFESVEECESVSAWALPSVDDGSRLILSAKKEQEKRKKKEKSETIEDCENPDDAEYPTAEALQKITEEAKQEGFSQGYKDGFDKGRQKGEKEAHNKVYKETKSIVDNEVAQLKMITNNLFQPMQMQKNTLEDIVIDMAMHFAQKILDQEIENTPRAILTVVEKALQALPVGASNITAYTHTNDAELIEKYLPAKDRHWALKTDNTIQRGGCRVETTESLVDYTTTSRLHEFIKHVQLHGDVSDTEVAPVEQYSNSVESEHSSYDTSTDSSRGSNDSSNSNDTADTPVDNDGESVTDSTPLQNTNLQDTDLHGVDLQDSDLQGKDSKNTETEAISEPGSDNHGSTPD